MLSDAGAKITPASPLGGQPPVDRSRLSCPGYLSPCQGRERQALISGRQVTGYTNTEEAAAGLTGVVPFLVGNMLLANGGIYSKGSDWTSHVVIDGKLVTGQSPASPKGVGEALVRMLA